MRILVDNANTTQAVTETVAREARAVASPGTEIVAVTASFGASVISTRTENAIAEHALVGLMATHHRGCDAAVIGVSYDTGLRAARELLPIPVVGMTEAGCLTACMLGGRFGIVTFGRRTLPVYRELIELYGLGGRLAGLRAIEAAALDIYRDPTIAETELVAEALRLVEEDGAEAVILSGAAMAGMPRKLQSAVPVPLIDGVGCAVRHAETLARMKLPKPRAGSYAALPEKTLVAVDPAIAALFSKPS
jgi:allantoin racemase